jgi:hypothetical protein
MVRKLVAACRLTSVQVYRAARPLRHTASASGSTHWSAKWTPSAAVLPR